MDDEHLRETTVASRTLHEGRFITFRLDTIEDADGTRHTREIAAHPGAVTIVPVHAGELLFVRQFRHAAGEVVLELPAGTLERLPGGRIEQPDAAASRELGEETGYGARTWQRLGRFWTAPGFTDELMHLFLAADLEPIAGYAGPDVDERLELVMLPWTEALAMAERGELVDAKTIVGVLRLGRLVDAGEVALPGGG